mgnify:FL=1
MSWKVAVNDYVDFVRLEKSLSDNSVSAYRTDMQKLTDFMEGIGVEPESVTMEQIQNFLAYLNDLGLKKRS